MSHMFTKFTAQIKSECSCQLWTFMHRGLQTHYSGMVHWSAFLPQEQNSWHLSFKGGCHFRGFSPWPLAAWQQQHSRMTQWSKAALFAVARKRTSARAPGQLQSPAHSPHPRSTSSTLGLAAHSVMNRSDPPLSVMPSGAITSLHKSLNPLRRQLRLAARVGQAWQGDCGCGGLGYITFCVSHSLLLSDYSKK